jgi:hypothetical protein
MKPIAKFDVSTVLYDAVVTVYQCYQDGIPYVHVWEYRDAMDHSSYNMFHKDWSDYDPLVIEVLVSHDIEATAIEVRDMIENTMVEHIAR